MFCTVLCNYPYQILRVLKVKLLVLLKTICRNVSNNTIGEVFFKKDLLVLLAFYMMYRCGYIAGKFLFGESPPRISSPRGASRMGVEAV